MINFNKVSFSYKKNKILNDFNYIFENVGMYAIIGESGCGKTTLLNLIGGLLKPTEGIISYSEDIKNINDSTALIFQDNNLFDNLTVYENIKLLVSFKNECINEEKIDSLLDEFKILKYKDKFVSKISGGERQRVSIIIALLTDKKVIIADEPLSSLDYTNSRMILNYLKELSKEKLIIFSSHNVDILNDYCDKIIDLENDRFDICEIKNLENPINKGKHLKFKTFIFTHSKILAKKPFIKIIASLFLSFCIAILSILLSISQISYDNVLLDELQKEKESPVIIQQVTDDKEIKKTFENYLNENGFEFFEGIKNGSWLGFNSLKNSNHNICVEIDNSMNDFEIIMTDRVFEEYRDMGIIPQNKSADNIDGLVYHTENLDCNNEPYEITIKDVIDTRKREMVENGKSILGSWFDYEWRVRLNKYTYAMLESNDIVHNPNLTKVIVNTNYEYGKYDRFKNIKCSYKNNILENEIVLTKKALEALEYINAENYNTGDEIVITEWLNDSKKFIIKEIDNISDEEIIYFSTHTLVEDKYEKFENSVIFYEIMNYTPENIIKMKNELSPYLFSFRYSNMTSEKLNVLFEGSSEAFEYYSELEYLVKMSLIILIGFSILALLFSVYYVVATYSINKNKFMILKIYGMKKSAELFLIEFDLLLLLIGSFVIGTILNILFNIGINNYFKMITGIDKDYNLFNFGNELLSFIIIYSFMSLLFMIFYFISSKKNLKTHVGN